MLGITLEQAFFVFGRLCLPARAARGKNGVDLARRFFLALHADDRQHAAGNIDADQIALFHQRDRPADSSLGADVADDRAPEKRPSVMRATLEASAGSAQMASPV